MAGASDMLESVEGCVEALAVVVEASLALVTFRSSDAFDVALSTRLTAGASSHGGGM